MDIRENTVKDVDLVNFNIDIPSGLTIKELEASEEAAVAIVRSNFKLKLNSAMNMIFGKEESPISIYTDLIPAIQAILDAVKGNISRGQVLMPTATGKTLVISEAMRILIDSYEKSSFVVTGSTIVLALQHVETFTNFIKKTVPDSRWAQTKIMLVCSDKERKKYIAEGDTLDEVTTDMTMIAGWIAEKQEENVPYIIVSTYHSLNDKVGGAYTNLENHHLDVTFYDEAHNATNNKHSETVYLKDRHSEDGILIDIPNYQSDFRFFLTATPRMTIRADKEKGEKVGTREIGMDKERPFGNPIYEMTPKTAINKGMIIPPVVMVAGLKQEFEARIARHLNFEMMGEIDNEMRNELRVETLLVYGGLIKLKEVAGKVKAIVYCRSVDHAENLEKNVDWAEMLDIEDLQTFFVASRVKNGARDRAMAGFRDAENAIIFNYRVLSEGVNIEDVNAVVMLRAFEDAVTLAQAIGRTLRIDPRDRIALAEGRISVGDIMGWIKPRGFTILPETMGRSRNKKYILGRSQDFIKNLYHLGYGDTRIMGFSLEKTYGKSTAKRIKKVLHDKYDFEYCDDNIESLAKLFEKHGNVSTTDIMSMILEEEKENSKREFGF